MKWLLLSTVALALAFAIGLAIVTNWTEYFQLTKEGVATQGRVVSKEPNNHQLVHYTYQVGARSFRDTGHAGYGNPEFKQLRIGDGVSVSYLTAKPEVSCLGDPAGLLKNETTFVGAAALVFPPLIVWRVSTKMGTLGRK